LVFLIPFYLSVCTYLQWNAEEQTAVLLSLFPSKAANFLLFARRTFWQPAREKIKYLEVILYFFALLHLWIGRKRHLAINAPILHNEKIEEYYKSLQGTFSKVFVFQQIMMVNFRHSRPQRKKRVFCQFGESQLKRARKFSEDVSAASLLQVYPKVNSIFWRENVDQLW
jgi:hypothetical protein